MFEIIRYSDTLKDEWNQYVAKSKNGTFLFDRNYMDYHSDRFDDYSLMFYCKNKLYAILPAHIKDNTLYSHLGLTYGGLIMDSGVTVSETVTLFHELNIYLLNNNIHHVYYKVIPWVYHQLPAEEDLYAIFRECNAKLTGRDIGSAILLKNKIRWSRLRRRGIKRATEAGVTVEKCESFESFWEVLDNNLMNKYDVKPVHTLDEIKLLKSRFPDNIILYNAYKDGKVLGGIVLYITPQVVHAQYSSATPEGKELGVIDAIYDRIINEDYKDYMYFDFGRSTEDMGHYLNEPLIFQKEGFGGRGICYDIYEWTL